MKYLTHTYADGQYLLQEVPDTSSGINIFNTELEAYRYLACEYSKWLRKQTGKLLELVDKVHELELL